MLIGQKTYDPRAFEFLWIIGGRTMQIGIVCIFVKPCKYALVINVPQDLFL
jgi:hypothetical protein